MAIDLNFNCCACGGSVGVTVNCHGCAANATTVASVKIPCPACGSIIRVAFDTDGTLRDVAPLPSYWQALEPSLN